MYGKHVSLKRGRLSAWETHVPLGAFLVRYRALPQRA